MQRTIAAIDFAATARTTFRAAAALRRRPPSGRMPPRTLATLAHALSVAPDLDAALLALADALAEVDRFAQIALVRYDARREMLRRPARRRTATPSRARALETTFDHLPDARARSRSRRAAASSTSASTRTSSRRCSRSPAPTTSGWLSLRGLRFEGQLSAVLVLYETRKFFGTRTSERFAPAAALFELALSRASPSARRARRRCARSRTSRSACTASTSASSPRSSSSCSRRPDRSARSADPERLGRARARGREGAGGGAAREPTRRRRRGAGHARPSSSSRRRTSSCIAAASRSGRRRARST